MQDEASNFDLSVTFLSRKVTKRTSKNKVCFQIAFIFHNGIALQILIYGWVEISKPVGTGLPDGPQNKQLQSPYG